LLLLLKFVLFYLNHFAKNFAKKEMEGAVKSVTAELILEMVNTVLLVI